MRIPVVRIVRDLGRRSSESFVTLLARHLDVTQGSAVLVRDFLAGELPLAEARRMMKAVEHEGDALRAQLVRRLSTAIVTPIDREDLFRLSRSIDDVLDDLRDFLREWDLFRMGSGDGLRALLEAIIRAVTELRVAVEAIAGAPGEVADRALAAKKACNVVRRLYQAEMARLFRADLDMQVLKRWELLRRLNAVGTRLDEAADVLADASIKRGD